MNFDSENIISGTNQADKAIQIECGRGPGFPAATRQSIERWLADRHVGSGDFLAIEVSHKTIVVVDFEGQAGDTDTAIITNHLPRIDSCITALHVRQDRRVIVVSISNAGITGDPGRVIETNGNPVGRRCGSTLSVKPLVSNVYDPAFNDACAFLDNAATADAAPVFGTRANL